MIEVNVRTKNESENQKSEMTGDIDLEVEGEGKKETTERSSNRRFQPVSIDENSIFMVQPLSDDLSFIQFKEIEQHPPIVCKESQQQVMKKINNAK